MFKDRFEIKDSIAHGLACGFCQKPVTSGEAHTCPGKEAAEAKQKEDQDEEEPST